MRRKTGSGGEEKERKERSERGKVSAFIAQPRRGDALTHVLGYRLAIPAQVDGFVGHLVLNGQIDRSSLDQMAAATEWETCAYVTACDAVPHVHTCLHVKSRPLGEFGLEEEKSCVRLPTQPIPFR